MGFGRRKQNILKKIIFVLIILILFSGTTYAAYYYFSSEVAKIEKEYTDKIDELKVEKYMLKREVYVPINNINQGVVINKENIRKKEIYSEVSSEQFMKEEDLGTRMLISVDKGMPILKNMISKDEVKDDIRLREISSVLLQSNLKIGDTIDFRIRYSNGLEFIVLSKKIIRNLDLQNNTLWINLNERESLMLSSALVDKVIYKGTSFYVNKYIEANLQKKSRLNYIPNIEIINLVKKNDKIKNKFTLEEGNIRTIIENNLVKLSDEDTSKVEESVDLEKTKIENRIVKEERIKKEKIKEEIENKESSDDRKESGKDGFN